MSDGRGCDSGVRRGCEAFCDSLDTRGAKNPRKIVAAAGLSCSDRTLMQIGSAILPGPGSVPRHLDAARELIVSALTYWKQ